MPCKNLPLAGLLGLLFLWGCASNGIGPENPILGAEEVSITDEMIPLLDGTWEGREFVDSGATSWGRALELEAGSRPGTIRWRRTDFGMRTYHFPTEGMATTRIVDGRIGSRHQHILYRRNDGQYVIYYQHPGDKGRWSYMNAPLKVNEDLAAYERGELVVDVRRVEPVPDIRDGYLRSLSRGVE